MFKRQYIGILSAQIGILDAKIGILNAKNALWNRPGLLLFGWSWIFLVVKPKLKLNEKKSWHGKKVLFGMALSMFNPTNFKKNNFK